VKLPQPDPDEVAALLGTDDKTDVRLGDSFWRPLFDVYTDNDRVFLTVELPGVDRAEVRLVVRRDRVRLAGRKPVPASVRPGVSFHSSEIPYGRFDLVVGLPVPVDAGTAHAVLKHGVLLVRLDRSRPSRRTVPVD
jgi:HSP20 family protein